jgi:hypothetical protein
MKKIYLMAAAFATLVGATSCSNENDPVQVPQGETTLAVKGVGLNSLNTKAGITATAFTGTEKLGLFIYRNTGISDANKDYNDATSTIRTVNVEYSAVTPFAAVGQGIVLSNVMGTVYSYYPYDAANESQDGTAIPVTVADNQGTGQSDGTKDVNEQTDYMWSDPVSNISKAQPTVALSMNHALAMVSFKFVQTDDEGIKYPGEGKVSAIVLKNKSTKTAIKSGNATMHIGTGDITGGTASANGISLAPSTSESLMDVEDPAKLPRLLLYPTAVAAGDAEVTITVDGNSYTLDIPAVVEGYKAGNNYEYTFTMKGTDLEITNVTIKAWITTEINGGDIQNPD